MKPTLMRCPKCNNSLVYRIDNPSRPFCSPRCKLLDLGAWAEARYAIAGPTAMSEVSGFDELMERPNEAPTAEPHRGPAD